MLNKLRRITLHQQGLTKVSPFGTGKQGVVNILQHLGYIQIDTLSVVERAHHHTIWARIPKYKTNLIGQLIKERLAFEYWFHAASYLPMRDYRYALPSMASIRRGESRYFNSVDPKLSNRIIARIRTDGPLKARDFSSAKKTKGSWWNWNPTKHALEKLFMQGDLMICDRQGMEKVYDLTERVLPDDICTTEPSILEFAEYLANTALSAHGFTTIKQILHLRTGSALRQAVQTVLEQKMESGEIIRHRINDIPGEIYAPNDLFDRRITISKSNLRILSPFDNAIIHRDRIKHLFQFDYHLECYVPKTKRRFGYFCLPILYIDEFIGRADCKVHRDTNRLQIIHLHIDKKHTSNEHCLEQLKNQLRRFSTFNACTSIEVNNVSPKNIKKMLKQKLEN